MTDLDFADNVILIDSDVKRIAGADNSGRAGKWVYVSVIFVLTYFLVLILVAVFEIFFSFSFVLVFIIFSF